MSVGTREFAVFDTLRAATRCRAICMVGNASQYGRRRSSCERGRACAARSILKRKEAWRLLPFMGWRVVSFGTAIGQ
jgi:hypothetical protein